MTQINCRELLGELKQQNRINALKDFVTVQEMAMRSARREAGANIPIEQKQEKVATEFQRYMAHLQGNEVPEQVGVKP